MDMTKEIEDLNEKVDDLNDRCDGLFGKIIDLQKAIESLEAKNGRQ